MKYLFLFLFVAACLSARPGELEISSDPPGAAVQIGKKNYTTPVTIKLHNGTYQVSINMDNYEIVTDEIEITKSYTAKRYKLKQIKGSIVVKNDVPDLHYVILDQEGNKIENKGEIPSGTYQVLGIRNNKTIYNEKIRHNAARPTSITLVDKKISLHMHLPDHPDITLRVDGQEFTTRELASDILLRQDDLTLEVQVKDRLFFTRRFGLSRKRTVCAITLEFSYEEYQKIKEVIHSDASLQETFSRYYRELIEKNARLSSSSFALFIGELAYPGADASFNTTEIPVYAQREPHREVANDYDGSVEYLPVNQFLPAAVSLGWSSDGIWAYCSVLSTGMRIEVVDTKTGTSLWSHKEDDRGALFSRISVMGYQDRISRMILLDITEEIFTKYRIQNNPGTVSILPFTLEDVPYKLGFENNACYIEIGKKRVKLGEVADFTIENRAVTHPPYAAVISPDKKYLTVTHISPNVFTEYSIFYSLGWKGIDLSNITK